MIQEQLVWPWQFSNSHREHLTDQQAAGLIKHLVLLHTLHSKYCLSMGCLQLPGVQEAGIRLQVEEFQEKDYLEDQDQQQYQMLNIPIEILVTNSIDLTFKVNKKDNQVWFLGVQNDVDGALYQSNDDLARWPIRE